MPPSYGRAELCLNRRNGHKLSMNGLTPMTIAPKWLDLEQIERRREVLQTVEWLMSLSRVSDRSSVSERFDHAVVITACQAVREASAALRVAAAKAEQSGAAPVEQHVLDLVRNFNSIGPARLEQHYQLLIERARSEAQEQEDVDAEGEPLTGLRDSNHGP